MKPIAFIFLLAGILIVQIHAGAELASKRTPSLKVEYKVSRVHGLFDFAMTIAGEPHHAAGIKMLFETSKENTPQVQKAIAAIQKLNRSLGIGIQFATPVASRPRGSSIGEILVSQSLFAKDLGDFQNRSLGLLTSSDQAELFEALAQIEPVYDRLVWKKSLSSLKAHQKKLEALAKRADLDQMFSSAVKFYRAQWPAQVPFSIGLYPVPFIKEKSFINGTSSSSHGSMEEHGVSIGVDDDLDGSFAVIFHELCHSVYAAQADEVMTELDRYFMSSPSRYKVQAYNYINEALATSIGNGWAYERVTGRLDKSWYNNEYIEGFARVIYPMTKDYLDSGRAIDQAFITRSIDYFAARFPDAPFEFHAIFNKVIIISEGNTIRSAELKRVFRSNFNISGYSGGTPLLDPETLDDAKKTDSTLVVVITNDQIDAFAKFAAKVPFLLAHLGEIKNMDRNQFYSALDENGRPYIVLKLADESKLEESVAHLKALKSIDPKKAVRVL